MVAGDVRRDRGGHFRTRSISLRTNIGCRIPGMAARGVAGTVDSSGGLARVEGPAIADCARWATSLAVGATKQGCAGRLSEPQSFVPGDLRVLHGGRNRFGGQDRRWAASFHALLSNRRLCLR